MRWNMPAPSCRKPWRCGAPRPAGSCSVPRARLVGMQHVHAMAEVLGVTDFPGFMVAMARAEGDTPGPRADRMAARRHAPAPPLFRGVVDPRPRCAGVGGIDRRRARRLGSLRAHRERRGRSPGASPGRMTRAACSGRSGQDPQQAFIATERPQHRVDRRAGRAAGQRARSGCATWPSLTPFTSA